MRNGWKGGQYSLYRVLLGLFFCFYFLHLLPWGAEIFSNHGALALSTQTHGTAYFPNLLAHWNGPLAVELLLGAGAVLSLLLAAGFRDRWAAIGLWYLWACLLDRNPLILNPHLPFLGWVLLAHSCLPTAPSGSMDSFLKKERNRSWEFPPLIYGAAWLVISWSYSYSGYWKMFTPAWRDGSALSWILRHPEARDNFMTHALANLPSPLLAALTWGVLWLEFLYGPLSIFKRLRPWVWGAMLAVQLTIFFMLHFFELTLGMVLVQLFLFDPAWIAPQKKDPGLVSSEKKVRELQLNPTLLGVLAFAFLYFNPSLGHSTPTSSFSNRDQTLQTSYGQFMLSEPLGWFLDLHPDSEEEALAVLYPKGTSPQTAPSVIYVYVAGKDEMGFKDLKSFIKKDEAAVKQDDPQIEVEEGSNLQTRLQKIVHTLFCIDERLKQFEGSAYIEEKDAVIRLTMESGDVKIFNEDLPALQELVASYEWLWDGPAQ